MDAASFNILLHAAAYILEVFGVSLFIIFLYVIYVDCVLPAWSKLRGFSVKELAKLPEVRGRELGVASECCICLDSVEPEDPVRLLPGCNHGFHSACIDAWLSRQPRCPLCRSDVRLEPPDQGTRGDSGSVV
uniref:RING-type domain-containing protein n=1 Tax=Kalanchoe fedtschenkoi TaxID=63787 RepID=A0A7N1A193_KALFE